MSAHSRIAVVLFNLGGPDRPEAVLPFLRNLFRDPAILRVPTPVRVLLAEWIARRRAPIARAIYAQIGGRSPIREQTDAQARALATALSDAGDVRTFAAMRYWHPRAAETVAAVRAFAPDRTVLVPLYPQYSTTTTASSVAEWQQLTGSSVTTVGCYGTQPWFLRAYADCIRPALDEANRYGSPRVLFSAHGLPLRIADSGDPYPGHAAATAAAIAAELGLAPGSWRLCYQSRVGRLAWIGPSIDAEIAKAGADRVPVVVAPISFVSEHSETLVELDIELREAAAHAGVPAYVRAPTVATNPQFINGLAGLVRAALAGTLGACPRHAGHRCPSAVCARGGAAA